MASVVSTNTVVVVSPARTHEAAASAEEICSSNSINAALGIALSLLPWQEVLSDRFMLFLDMPLTIMLSLAVLVGVIRRRLNRVLGLALLCVYVAWVGVHLLL